MEKKMLYQVSNDELMRHARKGGSREELDGVIMFTARKGVRRAARKVF